MLPFNAFECVPYFDGECELTLAAFEVDRLRQTALKLERGVHTRGVEPRRSEVTARLPKHCLGVVASPSDELKNHAEISVAAGHGRVIVGNACAPQCTLEDA